MFWCCTIDHRILIQGDLKYMIITITQEVDLAIKPLDKKGNSAQVDGTPVWTTSNSGIATVTPAPDGLSCIVKGSTEIGHVQIQVTADADLGTGIRNITGVLEIDVVAGEAVTLGIIAGTPREQAN